MRGILELQKIELQLQELQWRKTFQDEFAASKVNYMVLIFCTKHEQEIHPVIITSTKYTKA